MAEQRIAQPPFFVFFLAPFSVLYVSPLIDVCEDSYSQLSVT